MITNLAIKNDFDIFVFSCQTLVINNVGFKFFVEQYLV